MAGASNIRAHQVSNVRDNALAVHKAKEVTPAQVIPMADGDFKDFE